MANTSNRSGMPLGTATNIREGEVAWPDAIRLRAYALYESRGKQDGHDVDDWLIAERQMIPQPTAVMEGEER